MLHTTMFCFGIAFLSTPSTSTSKRSIFVPWSTVRP